MLFEDDICVTSGIRKEEGKEEMFLILYTLADQLLNGRTTDLLQR